MPKSPLAAPPPSGSSDLPATSPEAAAACPGCGRAVDPLRAGHVAILGGRFAYFCGAECKLAFERSTTGRAEDDVPTASPPPVSSSRAAGGGARESESESEADPAASSEAHAPSAFVAPSGRNRVLASVDAAGIACGAWAPALALLGPAAAGARLPLAVASMSCLLGRLVVAPRDRADPHPLVVAVPAVGAVASAIAARFTRDPHAAALAVFAAVACASAIAVEALVGRARARVAAARERIEGALDVRVRAVHGDGPGVDRPVSEVHPGEQVVVEPGEVVGVDATVTAGEARVVPWLDARVEVLKREGDCVLAGARVLSNRLRMTTTWSGPERAWLKLICPAASRVDVAAPTPRAVRHAVERGAPVAAIVVGVAALAANAAPVEGLALMCAGAMAFAAKASCAMVGLHFARAHLEALSSGIVYRDARAFERAAVANVAVLSARGTVLLGEPEIVAVEPVGPVGADRVLSLAAGAEAVSAHPFAAAVLRAARVRGVRPDPVRNGAACAGLGVTAVASTGERLVVGGRAIMLKEKIGVAVSDARVSELEAQGRSVLLVALGDRLIGVLALQDGLRPGARAAVQRLLDARIEPVLLSGEARETCDTIGRALDVEHVRPEVLPADRGAEVRALAEGGHVVAVVGHPARDDGALGAADVAVALGAAGSTPGEWAVVLVGDDVRDAARALAIPHAARDRARTAIAIGAAPGLVALLALAFGVAPPVVAPLAALLGAVAVAAHAREQAG